MNSTTYENIDRRLLEGLGVVEVYELYHDAHHLTVKDVYRRWRQLHELGQVTNSPYSMVQERVRGSPDYPWKVVVLSALMNRTHARQVRPVVKPLFQAYPTPASMRDSSGDLEDLIRPLGFAMQRARRLRNFSKDYASGMLVQMCRGVGAFGMEAHMAFVEGRTDFRPTDGFLVKYVEWRRTGLTEWDD